MASAKVNNLFDPHRGGRSVRLREFQLDGQPHEPARTNYFSVYWINTGSGSFHADSSRHLFGPDSLLFFIPYQYVRFVPDSPCSGQVIEFHANFLCVETFHAEVGCSGILFNDPQRNLVVRLDRQLKQQVKRLVDEMRRELGSAELASSEVVLAYLKVLLILASRTKTSATSLHNSAAADPRDQQLARLRELIEANYQTWRSPSDYAKAMHTTAKTLGRAVREHLGTTITDLIRDRVLIHAKWQLLHTLKPVKQVARELGYADELYFSRLFKKSTGVSPTFFREFETEIRNGSNLSMLSSDAPIL